MFLDEVKFFQARAGELPSHENQEKYKDIGALWVVSGGGTYLSALVDSPSDRSYGKYPWYIGQDKVRLDYAKRWLDAYSLQPPFAKATLIYNGTKEQNRDLLRAISDGKFDFARSSVYISQANITRTIEQIKNFSLPDSFDIKGEKLAVLSHSAHLPRILRFMNKFPNRFKGVKIVPLSVNLDQKSSENQMAELELNNLLGYIERGEASAEPYPYRN